MGEAEERPDGPDSVLGANGRRIMEGRIMLFLAEGCVAFLSQGGVEADAPDDEASMEVRGVGKVMWVGMGSKRKRLTGGADEVGVGRLTDGATWPMARSTIPRVIGAGSVEAGPGGIALAIVDLAAP